MSMLSVTLDILKTRLATTSPTVEFIETANTLLLSYPRAELPDWVEALANGNPEMLESVVEVALEDIRAEEE